MPSERTKRFTIWLSPTERDRLHQKAASQRATASDLVRAHVFGPAATRALPSRDLLTAAVRHAAGAAKNLNQIAKQINAAGKAGTLDAVLVKSAIKDLRKIYDPIVGGLDDIQAE